MKFHRRNIAGLLLLTSLIFVGFQNCSGVSLMWQQTAGRSSGHPGGTGGSSENPPGVSAPIPSVPGVVGGGGGNGDSYGGMTFFLLQKDFQCHRPDGTPVTPMVKAVVEVVSESEIWLHDPCAGTKVATPPTSITFVGPDREFLVLDEKRFEQFDDESLIPSASAYNPLYAVCISDIAVIAGSAVLDRWGQVLIVMRSGSPLSGNAMLYKYFDSQGVQTSSREQLSSGAIAAQTGLPAYDQYYPLENILKSWFLQIPSSEVGPSRSANFLVSGLPTQPLGKCYF